MSVTKSVYERFLTALDKKISEVEFEKTLNKVRKIDEKHYSKAISVQEMKNIIAEYKEKEIVIDENIHNIQVILPGNPEIVFRLGIEAVRNNVNMLINIEDFCLAQNTFLVDVINTVLKDMKMLESLKLNNLLTDKKIVEISKKLDLSMCIGNSNDYNMLSSKIPNLKFYPYNILELYSDSDSLEEVRKAVYDYAMLNEYEIEIYDMDLEINEVIEEMNRDGYGFCSILLSKDKDKINKFKNEIKSKYVVVNENPFKKLKFEFNLKGC